MIVLELIVVGQGQAQGHTAHKLLHNMCAALCSTLSSHGQDELCTSNRSRIRKSSAAAKRARTLAGIIKHTPPLAHWMVGRLWSGRKKLPLLLLLSHSARVLDHSSFVAVLNLETARGGDVVRKRDQFIPI